VYISPYRRQVLVPPNFMKFGIRGQLTDIIKCVKFLVDQFRGYGVLTPQNCPLPSTCCVALTTAYVRQLSQFWKCFGWFLHSFNSENSRQCHQNRRDARRYG